MIDFPKKGPTVTMLPIANSLVNIHLIYWITLILSFTPWEFFTSALVDGLSLEFEWQQVSSSIQDSSLYSGCSQ